MNHNPLKTAMLMATLWLSGPKAPAAIVAHFPFDPDDSGRISETVSSDRFDVLGNFGAESAPGVRGRALLLDGYTSYVGARVRHLPVNRKMTVSLWVAVQSYPVVKVDDPNPGGQTCIINCLDDNARSGFGYFIGFDGQYSFQVYVGGEKAIVNVAAPLPRYRWNCLTAVVDADSRKLRFYNNGELAAETDCLGGDISVGDSPLHVAQDGWEVWFGSGVDAFRTTAFGGLLDELTIYDEALQPSDMAGWRADSAPLLSVPESRYADDRWHPRFHGCPTGGWTNETHGLIHADGRYHLFFQKNAAGPYMARLHWGHLSSENLYDWQEERIALAPGDPYVDGERFHSDMKGCWSGCVYSDGELTGGKPAILYTGVDFERARILGATPASGDNSLLVWEKNRAPLIDGRPDGLSDDFRDPYFFRDGEKPYIIVGSQKEGRGAVTLHRRENGGWTRYAGDLFYHASDVAADGTFIEMPSVTRMPDGRWLFIYTPLATSEGVKAVYRTGAISSEGRFVCDAASSSPRPVDLFGRDGFGLLSPSVTNVDGRVIALGIVADKLGSADNKANGWAHCYSLPRELTLDRDGNLWQKPAAELAGMRTARDFHKNDFNLNGTVSLGDVRGRDAEIRMVWTCGDAPAGIRFFKNPANPDHSHAAVCVDPTQHTVTVDLTHLPRIVNDGYPYGGIYRAALPDDIAPGKEVSVDLFIDRSIIDLFVNDRYAASVRVFPHDLDGLDVEAFADGNTRVKSLDGWTLDSNRTVSPSGAHLPAPDLTGRAAILIADNNPAALSPQEQAALELFGRLYPEGSVLTPAEAPSRLSADKFGTLWIHIDRVGSGAGNLPSAITAPEVTDAIRAFHLQGGNLLLTKHATQLVTAIGRVDPRFAPGIYSDGAGGNGTDVWTVNAQIGWAFRNDRPGEYYDRRGHGIYDGLMTSPAFEWETFPMEGTGDGSPMWREDHNCVWDLNAYTYSADGANTVERFERENNAVVLGTWGHVVDHAVAGIVEFAPDGGVTRAYSPSGIIIANGIAACELSPRFGGNTYAANVERLNANSMAYLMSKDRNPTVSGVDMPDEDNKPRIFPVDNDGIGYSGVTPGTMFTVVSADGRVLDRRILDRPEGVIHLRASGVVIARAGQTAAKLLLR
ncbi:MAG: GH32 C-terminal domain-containing protein [Muribaculaceae bacterium]|nr:GH32 C-terminal domain-containing protein [Muribaculaceae bacterium]